MASLFSSRLAALAFMGAGLAFVGCDSDGDDPPVTPDPVTPYCDLDNEAFGCPDSGIVYDTTVVGGVNQVRVRETLDNTGVAGSLGSVTWTADNEYILEGLIFVNPGQTLTIEPGTVVRGTPGQGRRSSALVVARGGEIQANGTAEAPIIFTALSDDLSNPNDLIADGQPVVGEWGGVIILGSARTNAVAGEVAIEGIDTSEPRGLYGGTNDGDNSGSMRYVSIRHGGTLIGEGNEINGLTLGAVGSGTTLEYIEVFANLDDGVEWFGGTAQIKYLAAAFCGDDIFDYDVGFRGKTQYVFGIMGSESGDNGGEHDGGVGDLGGDAGEASQPFAKPVFWNATYVGSGNGAANDSRIFNIRDNAGGFYHRSLFAEFTRGVEIEDRDDTEDGDSRARLEAGDLVFDSNVFANIGPDGTLADSLVNDFALEFITDEDRNNRFVSTTPLQSIGRSTSGGLSPLPSGSVLTSNLGPAPEDAFFDNTSFIGAFGDTNWLLGWTALDAYGYLD